MTAPPRSRMGIALLALIGLFVSAYLALHKLGLLGTLQCGVGDCGTVQSSRYAVFLGFPVPYWGLAGYAAFLVLALLGIQPRWAASRPLAVGLFALSAAGLAFSAYLTYLEAAVIRAWCQWCVASAVIAVLIFLLSIPGLRPAR